MCWLLSLKISVEAFAQLEPVVHITVKLLVSHLLLFQAGLTLCSAGCFLPYRQAEVAGSGPVFSVPDSETFLSAYIRLGDLNPFEEWTSNH